ncbi:MAG: BamA/TamA family outer membrane protein, partial [Gemmatimonadetes bacterium]|nr:BamA/TamA family outer membrane protein [Gemmatimonadota bacterium]
VAGSVTVVGGQITGGDSARVRGEMNAYFAPLEYVKEGERLVLQEPATVGDSTGEGTTLRPRRGRTRLVLATEGSYNRVEGLPITFGPVVETPWSNPFRLRARGIFRTEAEGPFRAERWGGDVVAEQFLGGRSLFRVGGAVRSIVSPIEGWHLTNVENSLSTFVFHRDFRDYYQRQGYSVFATAAPRRSPFAATLEYRAERHVPLAAGNPWTIFNNSEAWRLQPYSARGDLNSLLGSMRWDGRNDPVDPSAGWYFETELERAVRSTLKQPELATLSVIDDEGTVVRPERPFGLFTHGMVDIRRYNRISPTSRLNLRVMAAGIIGGGVLPPQRQHALGGEASLPGFNILSLDCAARGEVVRIPSDPFVNPPPRAFFGGYGCNRVVLVQAEVRGNVDFRINVGQRAGRAEEGEDDSDTRFSGVWDGTLGWIFFADAGSGWGKVRDRDMHQDAADVGAGILLGRLGVYAAVPVASDGRFVRPSRGPNFFVRLNSRF